MLVVRGAAPYLTCKLYTQPDMKEVDYMTHMWQVGPEIQPPAEVDTSNDK